MSKITEKGKGFISDFKAFIMRGNVIDMAVAVIMGASFNKITTSLVNDVIMPAIGAIIGGINFTDLKYVISEAVVDADGVETVAEVAIKYGSFIQSIVDFLIIAFSMFVMIKVFAALSRKKKVEEEPAPPVKPDDVVLLEEIRDILKEKEK